ncbi:MAG: GldG family protein [Hespellia sp.]|nr:GldG family protein [Hespellia sp.]
MNKIKKLLKTTETRNGSYSVGLVAIVIAIVVVVNLIVGQLPEKIRNIDISSNNIYEITDTSREILSDLNQKVTFTVLADKENTDERIKTFLSKYTGLSKNISVTWIDPVLHPSALTENDAESDTIVINCEDTGKSTTVAFSDIIVSDEYASYYSSGSSTETEFDGEGQLTSAVNYVTTDKTQTIYRTAGHGESTLATSISDLMTKSNYTVTELNLMMDGAIPDDCDLLFMYAPTTDLSEEETGIVSDYLAAGGKVMILLGEQKDLPNLTGLMKDYGMDVVDGYIADASRCYQGNYYYLFPNLTVSGDMSKGISSQMVLLVNAQGMNLVDPARDTITATGFMSTSTSGYAVTESGQTQGTYYLGAYATENVSSSGNKDGDASSADSADSTDSSSADTTSSDSGDSSDSSEDTSKESRLTVISAGNLINSQITDSFSTLENNTLFMNAVAANFDGTQNISIEPKSLSVEYNTMQYAGLISLAVIFGIPLIVLICGFVVWFRRRKA